MKKLVSLLLCIATLVSMTLPAAATEATEETVTETTESAEETETTEESSEPAAMESEETEIPTEAETEPEATEPEETEPETEPEAPETTEPETAEPEAEETEPSTDATEASTESTEGTLIAEAETYAANSGTCGDNLTWTLNNGTLTISGTGDMWGFGWGGAPWCSQRENIRTVVIKKGVTHIGECAFDYCTSMTSVDIPNGVTSIGSFAFSDCTGLTSVTIPSSVTDIGHGAFDDCTGLTSAVILGNVTAIEEKTFYKCDSLTSVTIPGSVTTIGDDAFYECDSLIDVYYGGTKADRTSKITIAEGNSSLDDPMWHYSDGTAEAAGTMSNGVTWTLVNGTLTISGNGEVSYYPWDSQKDRIKTIIIGDGITSIYENLSSAEHSIFYNYVNLQTISVDENNSNFASIDGVLFTKDKSELIHYPTGRSGAYTIPSGTTSIREWAFACCSGLTSVTIPEGVTELDQNIFYNCTGLTSVSIPSSVTSITNQRDAWGRLVSTFYGCSSLQEIQVDANNENYTSENGVLFEKDFESALLAAFTGGEANDKGNLVLYPAGRSGAYTIPDGVTRIGDDFGYGAPFYGCTGLTAITIPSSVTTIDNYSFYGCTGLTDVYYGGTEADRTSNMTIGEKNEYLERAVWHYSDGTVAGASGSCGDSLTWSLDNGTLTIRGSGAMRDYSYSVEIDTEQYTFTTTSDLAQWNSSRVKTAVIGSGVTSIGDYAFYSYCDNLTYVIIPSSVTSIGEYAFFGCDSLTDVYYDGTEADRNSKLTIESGNDDLINATWHYNDSSASSNITVFRTYNSYSGEHLLCTSVAEVTSLISAGWSLDGVMCYMPTSGTPIYRLYNPTSGEHLYTMVQAEIDTLTAGTWTIDGVIAYSAGSDGLPIYRLYNSAAPEISSHLLSTSQQERETLEANGWTVEGIALYAAK